jgi:hypothetical protein
MLRSWMLGGLCAVALASASASWGGIVETRDGRTIEGDVTIQGDQVFIDRHGMRFAIDRSDVRSISNSDSVVDEYKRRHDKLAAGDVHGRVELAHWLLDKKEYDLSRQVLAEARQLSFRNTDVIAMQEAVDRQQDLDQLQARKHAPAQFAALDNAAAPPPATAPASQPAQGPVRPLTADEINVVRQNEWSEGQQMSATFKNDVRRTYTAHMQLSPSDFNRMTPAAQAWAILQNGTPDMKASVILRIDPLTMIQFKQLQRSLLNSCAQCHAYGKTTSRFALKWPANSDGDTYANFVILNKFSTKIGDRDYMMIDRDHPTDSLLLQYAIPPAAGAPGTVTHPALDGKYKGVIHSASDTRFQAAQTWLTQTLDPRTPDYSSIDVGSPDSTPRKAKP